MKVILEFELPGERNESKLAVYGPDFFTALWDIQSIVRGVINGDREFDTPDLLAAAINEILCEEPLYGKIEEIE